MSSYQFSHFIISTEINGNRFFILSIEWKVAIFDCFLQKLTRIQISNCILWTSNFLIFSFCFVQFCNRKQYGDRYSFNFFIWNIDFELNFMLKLFGDFVFLDWHWNYEEDQAEKKNSKLNLHLNKIIKMQIDFIKFLFVKFRTVGIKNMISFHLVKRQSYIMDLYRNENYCLSDS